MPYMLHYGFRTPVPERRDDRPSGKSRIGRGFQPKKAKR